MSSVIACENETPGSTVGVSSPQKGWALALLVLALLAALSTVGTALALDERDITFWGPMEPVSLLPKGNAVWSDFQPTDWVSSPFTCTITVYDPDGLQPETAVYYTSIDGGITWMGGYTPETYSPVSTTVYITCPNLNYFPDGSANRIRFEILDIPGEVEGIPVEQIPVLWVDSTEPDSSVSTSGTYGIDWPGQITGTASDATSGVQRVEITIQRHDPAGWWNGSNWDIVPHWLLTSGSPTSWFYAFAPSDGETYTVQSRATDNAGNRETSYGVETFTYDISAPEAPTIDVIEPTPGTWSNTNCYTVTWTNPSNGVPIAAAYYSFTEPTSDEDYDGFVTGPDVSSIECLSVPGDGKYDIYIWLEDELGNRDYHNYAYREDAFWYDSTAPTLNWDYDRDPNSRGWFTSTVELSLYCDDPGVPDLGSGCDYIEWRHLGEEEWLIGGFIPVTDDAERVLEARGTDMAGNTQDPPVTITVPIDLHAPETVHEGRLPDHAGWYTAPVTVTLLVSDLVSGPDVSYYQVDGLGWLQGNFFTVSGEGAHNIEYYSVDMAGNIETPHTFTEEYRIDTIAPTTTSDFTGTVDCEGWSQGPVHVNLYASDPIPGSGLDHTEYLPPGAVVWQVGNSFDEAREGLWVYQVRSVDVAGNVEASVPITVGIDATAPGSPLQLQATPPGWSNVPTFTLSWQNPYLPEIAPIRYAYCKLDAPPVQDRDPDAIRAEPVDRTMTVVVTEEGEHDAYLWLEDCAGNVDYRNAGAWPSLFKYDASPPETGYAVNGQVGLDPEWYVSDVVITLTPEDAVSAPAETWYKVDGGPWQMSTSFPVAFVVSGDGWRRRIAFYSKDLAGNVEEIRHFFVSIDTTPPSSPIGLYAQPATCAQGTEFTLSWSNPVDLSGIGGVWYKVGSPPTHDGDGVLVSGWVESITVEVPEPSGQYPIYVWLQDVAGNADYTTAVSVTVCHDVDAPVTEATVDCSVPGQNGWCLGTVIVHLNALDPLSGLSQIRYCLDGGNWQIESVSGTMAEVTVSVGVEGAHTLSFYAVDRAGNEENTRSQQVKIDLRPPRAWASAPGYSKDTTFTVSWDGQDVTLGGSVACYDVQTKTDAWGTWTNWRVGVTGESDTFTGEPGHIYYFRVRATDEAGRTGSWSPDDAAYVYIDPLDNGDFSAGLNGWIVPPDNELPVQVLGSAEACGTSPEVVLGNPGLGWGNNNVPVGRAAIRREIQVPSAAQVPGLGIAFKYDIVTYDLLEYPEYPWDSFDVRVIDGQGIEHLVLRDGNRDPVYAPPPALRFDLGCREFVIDLTAYAGQRITIEWANWNRHDRWYNTWTYLDDVRLVVPRRVCLPLVTNEFGGVVGGYTARPMRYEPPWKRRVSPPRRR